MNFLLEFIVRFQLCHTFETVNFFSQKITSHLGIDIYVLDRERGSEREREREEERDLIYM